MFKYLTHFVDFASLHFYILNFDAWAFVGFVWSAFLNVHFRCASTNGVPFAKLRNCYDFFKTVGLLWRTFSF